MNKLAESFMGIFLILVLLVVSYGGAYGDNRDHIWSEDEKVTLRSLWIGALPELPANPSNRYVTDPAASALGKRLFFDSRFSGDMKVSCATCHPANENFADNLPLAHGMGTTSRRTMPLIGVAYQTWLFWDGRKDSLWAQSLGPIESPVEHGFTRTQSAVIICEHYADEYNDIFGALPVDLLEHDLSIVAKPSPEEPELFKKWLSLSVETREIVNLVYANMGKAIEAYVRSIVPGPGRFDRYVEALIRDERDALPGLLDTDEVKGLRLFIGKAQCTNCHNGPLLTNGDFHNIGIPGRANLPFDGGRAEGILKVLTDEFNCLSKFSDADLKDCAELRFLDTDIKKYIGAFKTPTLRNVAERAPYMHAGQLATLHDVLQFYSESKSPEIGHGGLSKEEIKQLVAFLRTLSGPVQSD